MQRWVTPIVGLAAILLAIWLVAHDFRPPRAIGKDPHAGETGEGAATAAATRTVDAGPAGERDAAAPLLLSDLVGAERAEPRGDAGAGGTLFDGTPVPPLPQDAPRQVRFGVVLVSHAGAQPSAATGRPSPRAQAEAMSLAKQLLTTAQQDFHAAVAQGDPGSADDLGHVKLGVLEPAPEYVLFTLPVDGVGGPVETPRGYWIVKRLE
jgi:hypothetical protein